MIVCPLINSQISARISDSIRYRFVVDQVEPKQQSLNVCLLKGFDRYDLLLPHPRPSTPKFTVSETQLQKLGQCRSTTVPETEYKYYCKIEKENTHVVLRKVLRKKKRNCQQDRNDNDNNSNSSYILINGKAVVLGCLIIGGTVTASANHAISLVS